MKYIRKQSRSWKPLFAVLALLACSLAGPNAVAQALTSFTVTTSPTGTPFYGGNYLQINPTLGGSLTAAPTGSVTIFTSSQADCTVIGTYIGSYALVASTTPPAGNDYTSSANIYIYSAPVGTYYVCATYVPGGTNPFTAATTASGAQLTSYAAAVLTVTQQSFPATGQPVTLTVTLTAPAGQPAPSGSIVVQDSSGDTIPTETVSTSNTSFDVPLSAGTTTYTISFNSVGNYASQYSDGNVYYTNPLASISPAAIPSGSADTTLTLNGSGFTTGSIAQITAPSGSPLTLTTTYVSANQLTAVVPAASLATAQIAAIQVNTAGATTNSINLNIYALQSNTATVTASPSTFVYGQASTLNLGATITPVTAPGLPTGAVNFILTGPGGSTTQLALGSATLSAATGNGSLSPGTVGPALDSPSARAITADLNGDGYDDVVSLPGNAGSDFSSSYLQVFLSTGTNGFAQEQTIPTDCPGSDIAVHDINGDGKPDIITLCKSGNGGIVATYMLGNGDGTFQAPIAFLSDTTLASPSNVVIGDFNGDGKMDVALIDGSDGLIQVFTGGATFGTFTALPATTFASTGSIQPPVVADFNQDGKSDMVILGEPDGSGTGTLLLLTSKGDGTFTTQAEPFATTAYALGGPAITDVNGDGYPDVAVADPGNGDGGVSQILVFENNGSGALSAPLSYAVSDVHSVAGLPFPVIGKPSTTVTQPASIFYNSINPADGTTLIVGGLAVSGGTITSVYSETNAGYDVSSYGSPDLIFTGDFNGSGYDDVGTIADTANPSTNGYVVDDSLIPFFYTNSTTASLTGATQQPAAGTYTLTASYPGNKIYGASTSTGIPITIQQATPVLTWTTPAPIYYGTPLSSTQLDATVSGIPGTFTYTPAAGTVLNTGSQTLSVLFTPTDTVDYTTQTGSVTIDVQPGSILTSILPTSGNLGDPATTLTLTGLGFTAQSVAELNGTPLTTTYVSPSTLQAVIPSSFFTSVQSEAVTVVTPGEPSSSSIPFSVIAPPAQATFTGPSTADSGSQPTVNLQLSQSYPVPVTATLTLAVQPLSTGGLTDPAVQFATGGTTETITIPANTTTASPLQLQTGTLAATITVTTTLSAGGTDITPASLQPVVIQVPSSPPTISSLTLARSGDTVTVTVQGFANTRAVTSASFHFTAASGAQIANPDVTVQLGGAFSTWYGLDTSDKYGSAFSYVQTFTLSQDATSVGSVTVTLNNSLGSSNPESAQ